MSAYITQVKNAVDKLLRAGSAGHAVTAKNNNSPVLINENWVADTIDSTNLWASSVGGTGTAAMVQNEAGKPHLRLNCPAGADSVLLQTASGILYPNTSSITDANEKWTKLVIEWVARLGTVANIDNTLFLMGFIAQNASASSRSGTNVLGFALSADALQSLTDAGGTETLTAVASAPTLTDWNKYKVQIENGAVKFYANGVLKNTHAANIPTFPLVPTFRVVSEGAVASKLDLGPVSCHLEE